MRTIAVDLPSLQGNSGPPGDLHADAAHVRRIVERAEGPVLLVGHSYGGAVITEAGTHANVGHLVYLAALIPDATETSAQLLGIPAPSESDGDHAALADAYEPASRFYNDCDERTTTWACAHLRPQAMVWMYQRPRAVAWRDRPSTYVVCTNDRAIGVDLQRSWATRCSASVEWDSGHSPFLSHPTWVVDLLTETVGSTSIG
jgi:pimeloyl-ACP methyl ester carboxylesterase